VLLGLGMVTLLALAGVAFAASYPSDGVFPFLSSSSTSPSKPVAPATMHVPPFYAAACSDGDRNAVGNNVVVDQDEWLCGGASAIGGNVTVLGHVSGSATAVGGDVTVSGEVDGNVTAVGGDVTLLPAALVTGDVQAWGGRIIRAPDAVVRGSLGHVDQPQSLIQPDTWYFFPGHGIPWLNLIFWALAGAGIGYFFPTQLASVRRMAEARLGESLLLGMAALIAGVAASVLLLVTCVGIPLAIVLLLGLWVLSVFGTVALGFWLGELLMRDSAYRQRSSFVLAALIGTVLLALPAEIPCVGGLVRLAVTATGLGAASLTLYYARNAVGYRRA